MVRPDAHRKDRAREAAWRHRHRDGHRHRKDERSKKQGRHDST